MLINNTNCKNINLRLSIIIPALNEERNIKKSIESAKKLRPFEIIVVDGGSEDRTNEIAEIEAVFVIQSPKGRGVQMNKGASLAKGDILMFLHADAEIKNACQINIANLLNGHSVGFFRLRFNDNSLSTRIVEFFANLRARLFSLPYGDQAIIIRKNLFERIGGFKEYPFLEDLELVRRLRKVTKLRYIPEDVVVSSRRIQKGYPFSPILISLRNVLIASLFMLGISPGRLLRFYR